MRPRPETSYVPTQNWQELKQKPLILKESAPSGAASPILTPAASEVINQSRALVALWKTLRISGLSRAERNAAIEETRAKLIAAVERLD